jgi:hypothetical protein
MILLHDPNYVNKSANSLCTQHTTHDSVGEHHSVHGTHDRVLTQFWLAEHMATPRPPPPPPPPPPSLPPSSPPPPPSDSHAIHIQVFLAEFSPQFF